MKLLVALAVGLAFVGVAFVVSRFNARNSKPPVVPDAERANPLMAMRERLLSWTAEDFDLTPLSGGVCGVLMEMGHPEGWATIVAMNHGGASLYTSSGGGLIGGEMHERVAAAAREGCVIADGLAASLPIETDFPPPTAGRIAFRLLTADGVRSIDQAASALESGESRLTPLFHAMHEVISELRRASPAPSGD